MYFLSHCTMNHCINTACIGLNIYFEVLNIKLVLLHLFLLYNTSSKHIKKDSPVYISRALCSSIHQHFINFNSLETSPCDGSKPINENQNWPKIVNFFFLTLPNELINTRLVNHIAIDYYLSSA